MTTPNEELIASLTQTNQFHESADICTADVIDVLKSQADLARARQQVMGLSADAERYRWLTGARTAEQCNDENVGASPPLPQDIALAELSAWYYCKQDWDATIDAAIQQLKGGV